MKNRTPITERHGEAAETADPVPGLKFAHCYKLVKDIPGHAAGEEVSWRGGEQRFYFWLPRAEFELHKHDMRGPSFTVEQIQDNQWFKPRGELRDFIPPFPGKKALEQYVDLMPDCRLVDDVDQCRAINGLLADSKFQDALYEFYREQYNAFYFTKKWLRSHQAGTT